jgi:rhomboid protease GluP
VTGSNVTGSRVTGLLRIEDDEPASTRPFGTGGSGTPPRVVSPLERRPVATLVIAATVVIGWGIQVWLGIDDLTVLRLGANSAPLVRAGEIDRLVTASWLHGHWIHFGINIVGLWFLGSAIERLMGSVRFLAIYLVSCLAGAFASYYFTSTMVSVGASTGLAGLFSALGYVLIRFRRELPAFIRRALRVWFLLLGLNVALGIAFKSLPIDHAGHGGGFVAGIAIAALMSIGWPPMRDSRTGRLATLPLVAIMVVVVALGLGASTLRALEPRGHAERIFTVLEDSDDPAALNFAAWSIAIAEEADRATLERAAIVSERSLALHRDLVVTGNDERATWHLDRGRYLDTLATVRFRLGDYDAAIALEREALLGPPGSPLDSRAYESQLARFLDARLTHEDTPLVIPAEAPALTLSIRSRGTERDLEMELTGEAPDGLELVGLVYAEDRLVGSVRGTLAPGVALPSRRTLDSRFPPNATIRVALVDATERNVEGFTLTQTPLDEEVAGYPGPMRP